MIIAGIRHPCLKHVKIVQGLAKCLLALLIFSRNVELLFRAILLSSDVLGTAGDGATASSAVLPSCSSW